MDEQALAFPEISPDLRARFAVGPMALRPFGTRAEDLNLELDRVATDRVAADRVATDRGDTAALVTTLLRACTTSAGGSLEEELFWQLPVGTRLQAMTLLSLSAEGSPPSLEATCPAPGCCAAIELEVPFDALLERAEAATGRVQFAADSGEIELRRPSGADLRRWAETSPSELEMVRDLLVRGTVDELSERELARIEEAISRHDPLVDCAVNGVCPDCGKGFEIPLDLERLALDALSRVRRRLLRTVDRLACAYGWSESEILALPAWRRDCYLHLIEQRED